KVEYALGSDAGAVSIANGSGASSAKCLQPEALPAAVRAARALVAFCRARRLAAEAAGGEAAHTAVLVNRRDPPVERAPVALEVDVRSPARSVYSVRFDSGTEAVALRDLDLVLLGVRFGIPRHEQPRSRLHTAGP